MSVDDGLSQSQWLPLNGLVIVELAGDRANAILGWLCSQLGAEVYLCDEQAAIGARHALPWFSVHIDRGKVIVPGAEQSRSLISRAQAVIAHPHRIAPWAADSIANTSAIKVWLSGYGKTGPRAYDDYTEAIIQSSGGLSYVTGDPTKPPLTVDVSYSQYLQAWTAASSLFGALHEGSRVEEIDVSAEECVAANLESAFVMATYLKATKHRAGAVQPYGVQGELFPCADGFITVHPGPAGWPTLAHMIGRSDLADHPVFTDQVYRMSNIAELGSILSPWLQTRTRAEVVAEAQEWRMPFGPALAAEEVLMDPQLSARGFLQPASAPGETSGLKVHGLPLTVTYGNAPMGEADAQGVSTASTPTAPAQKALISSSKDSGAPLSGVRVLDLTWVWAGPCCTRILADLGADVIKVESPSRPDSVRQLILDRNDIEGDFWNRAGYFAERNMGKKSVPINLNSDEGQSLFLDLLADVDLLVESFSPRVMENLGLTWERLQDANPRLLYLSMSGYGHDGPYRDWVSYGSSLEAHCGLTAQTRYPGERPHRLGLNSVDALSGVYAAAVVTGFILGRRRQATTMACHLDFSQFEAGVTVISEAMVDAQLDSPARSVPSAASVAKMYATRNDEWITVAGAPEIETTVDDRKILLRALQAQGVVAGPVNSASDLLRDHHLEERGFFTDVRPWPGAESRPFPRQLPGIWLRNHAEYRPGPQGRPPMFGEHVGKLGDWVSLPRDLDELVRDGVVGTVPPYDGQPARETRIHLDLLRELGAISSGDRSHG